MSDLPEPTARSLQIGRAAEHFVVADLLLAGHEACLTEAGMPYDVIADLDGRLLRIQVKATGRPRNANSQGKTPRIAYVWNVRKKGKHSKRRMQDRDCDIVALVALDIRTVAYIPVDMCGQTVILDPPGGLGQRITLTGKRYTKQIWSGDVSQYPLGGAICAS